MIDAKGYCDANVQRSIYNAVINAHFGEKNFYQNLYDRCFGYDNCGICSYEQYWNACIDYLNNMKYGKNGYEKWVKAVSWGYVTPTWKEEIMDYFNCKNNKEFIQFAKRIIEETI